MAVRHLERPGHLQGGVDDARRLIEQGGVEVEGKKLLDAKKPLPAADLVGRVLKIGKKNKFFRIISSKS